VVKDEEKKKQLFAAAGNLKSLADASVVIVALGDPNASVLRERLRFLAAVFFLHRIPHLQDPMIAVEHMVLASTALGYGACWIGSFRQGHVKKIIGIPEAIPVIAVVPIGVPDENPSAQPRKSFAKLFFEDNYGTPLKI
jgi:nitroreductase